MPRRLVLSVSLTRHALQVSLDRMQPAFDRLPADGPQLLDFDGGLDRRGRFAAEAEYWAYVRAQIVGHARRSAKPVEMVLLGGESATESAFLSTLRDALAEICPVLAPGINIDSAALVDPTYAAARGMALYARRRQEAPGQCKERRRCDEEREKERAGMSGQSRVDL